MEAHRNYNAPCELHIYRNQWKKGSYTWTFLDIEELLIALYFNITKTAKGHGLGDTFQQQTGSSQMAEKLQPHLQENHWKGLWSSAGCRRPFYYPIAVKPSCITNSGTQELLSYTEVCDILICGKLTNTLYKILQVTLSIEQWCGKTQIPIYVQKLQHLDQYLMQPVHLHEMC